MLNSTVTWPIENPVANTVGLNRTARSSTRSATATPSTRSPTRSRRAPRSASRRTSIASRSSRRARSRLGPPTRVARGPVGRELQRRQREHARLASPARGQRARPARRLHRAAAARRVDRLPQHALLERSARRVRASLGDAARHQQLALHRVGAPLVPRPRHLQRQGPLPPDADRSRRRLQPVRREQQVGLLPVGRRRVASDRRELHEEPEACSAT